MAWVKYLVCRFGARTRAPSERGGTRSVAVGYPGVRTSRGSDGVRFTTGLRQSRMIASAALALSGRFSNCMERPRCLYQVMRSPEAKCSKFTGQLPSGVGWMLVVGSGTSSLKPGPQSHQQKSRNAKFSARYCALAFVPSYSVG